MLRRSTWIVLVIFAVLVIAIIAWQRFGLKEEPVEPTATVEATEMVFDFSNQSITRYSISSADGSLITFEREPETGAWVVVDQPPELADSTQIETGANTLTFLTVSTKLATQPALEAMGLDKPAYVITLTLSNGEEAVLNVGDLTPTGTGYYVQADNDPAVVVSKVEIDTLINMLTTPPLGATYTPTVTMTETTTPTPTNTLTSTPLPTDIPEATVTPTP
jgi:hypothetical protein